MVGAVVEKIRLFGGRDIKLKGSGNTDRSHTRYVIRLYIRRNGRADYIVWR
jgi:hypothetical protein